MAPHVRFGDVARWIAEWQSKPSNIAHLAGELGADVLWQELPHWMLGLSYVASDLSERGTIMLNRDIRDTDLEVPVLCHEIGHLLLKHEYMHPCLSCGCTTTGEIRAWFVAAMLAIPQVAVNNLRKGRAFPDMVASRYRVPEQLVALRYGMQWRGDDPLSQNVRQTQMDRWLSWLKSRIASKSASRERVSGTAELVAGWRSSAVGTGRG